MNHCSKEWLLVAKIFTVVGAVVFVGAMALISFDFTKLSTQKLETNTYEFNEDFDNIFMNVDTAAVTFVPSEEGVCKVECVEDIKAKHSAKIHDGTLMISVNDSRKWYEYIGINFRTPNVTVYLPKAVYISLSVDTATGNIQIPDTFCFESVDVAGTTSNVVCRAQVLKSMEATTTTGNITVDSSGTETIKLSATTGNITVKDTDCKKLTAECSTGRIKLQGVIAKECISAENTTGGVRFEGCDADDITVHTTTGNVRGTLLSEKIFFTDTSTGGVSVPKTTSGGKCDITTRTGDIEIDVE